jgi:hypothetical protein
MNGFLKDKYGDNSSKRLIGVIGFAWIFILMTLDGFNFYSINEAIAISVLGICAALLGLDTVTDIWKKDKS